MIVKIVNQKSILSEVSQGLIDYFLQDFTSFYGV